MEIEYFLIIRFLIIAFLLFMSAMFSGTETAYTALDEVTLLRLIRKKKIKEKDKRFWTEKDKSLIPSLLLGNNIVNIVSTSIVTVVAIQIGEASTIISPALAILIITTIFTITLIICGEILPKTFMSINYEVSMPYLINFAKLFYYIFRPITLLLDLIVSFILKVATPKGMTTSDKKKVLASIDDVTSIINLGHRDGIIIETTRDLLTGVIDFRNKTVDTIMVPRVDMFCIESDMPIKDILALSVESGHSRFPVYDESIDHIIGIFHTKSIFKDYLKNDIKNKKAIDYIMLPYFVPETKPISMLFTEMQKQKLQMVIAIDEYGGTAGLVSMEDIIEEIMGEIEDESDKAQSYIKYKDGGNIAIVNGLAPISVVNRELKMLLHHSEYQTIAGYVLELLGCIPEVDDTFTLGEYRCRVQKMEDRRIIELEFQKIKH